MDISGQLVQNDHAAKFKISVDSRKSAYDIWTLDGKQAEFKIFRDVVGKVPLGNALFEGA